MTHTVIELIHNTALLMMLSIVYEISYLFPIRQKRLIPIVNGVFISLIGLAIMLVPFQFAPGFVFDTRTILIGVTALTFGPIPTLIAVCVTAVYRIGLGGVGAVMGVLTIVASAATGLIWRRMFIGAQLKHRWLNVYLFGVVVHIVMLLCLFAVPMPYALQALREIALPVLLIYPVATVLLSLLLIHQKERNEAMSLVAEAEERYRSLFSNSHAPMLLVDPENGQIMDANPAACNFYGWPLQVMKAMNISHINTLSPAEVQREMNKAVSQKRNHFLFQHRRASGQPVDVEVYSGPIRLNGGTHLYSIVHDISERTAATRALQESESRFRLVVEHAPDAIYIQIDGKFVFLNRAAVALFGADSAEALIGSPIMERIHPDYRDLVLRRIAYLSEEDSVAPAEEIYLRVDASPVYVDVNAVPIQYSNREAGLVFVRDISARKELEAQNLEMESQLRQQQKLEAIGTLAGGVAHEINNPINGIMNYAQLILDDLDGRSGPAGYAREIIRETERVSEIVRNLLQFSRQEKQSHSYANIYDIIDQTLSLIRTIIKKDQIEMEVAIDEGLPDIKCRSQQIQQVLMNLLTNARDAVNEKYPGYSEDKIIRLYCSQYRLEGRRWIRIVVEDHGNGIPKPIQEKIFEPFFSTKPKERGTGLGLAISFGIVKDHHGAIKIDTVEGSYTKFILDLPVDNGWKL